MPMPPSSPMPEYMQDTPMGVEGSMKEAFKTPKKKMDETMPNTAKEERSYMQLLKDMAVGTAANKPSPQPTAPAVPAYMPQQAPIMYGNQGSFSDVDREKYLRTIKAAPSQSMPPQIDPRDAASMRGAFRGR